MIEYVYCHSLKIPAKYHDNRLDISNVGSIFPLLCHFAPTSLTGQCCLRYCFHMAYDGNYIGGLGGSGIIYQKCFKCFSTIP